MSTKHTAKYVELALGIYYCGESKEAVDGDKHEYITRM